MVLLGSKDPAPFSIFNADSSSNLLFTSDHNGSAIPTKLKNLGVPLNELRRHVAYDIGIDAVAHALSARFNAPLIVANYSRLVIDCNRHPGAAGSIPSVSDNTVVPGNKNLSGDDIKSREDEIFDAYQNKGLAIKKKRILIRWQSQIRLLHILDGKNLCLELIL